MFPKHTPRQSRPVIGCLFIVAMAGAALAQPGAPNDRPLTSRAVSQLFTAQVKRIESDLADPAKAPAAKNDAINLLDYALAYLPPDDRANWIAIADLFELASQSHQWSAESQPELWRLLLKHKPLRRAITLNIDPKLDSTAQVYHQLLKLYQAQGDHIAQTPALTAALCLAHAQPIRQELNGRKLSAPAIEDLYTYFTHRGSRAASVEAPAELLVHMVNVAAERDDLAWATKHYASVRQVPRAFRQAADRHQQGRSAFISHPEAPARLAVVAEYGGDLYEQAWFAATVAKAVARPSAMVHAELSDRSVHAWVLFYEPGRRGGAWNHRDARYESTDPFYGQVINPRNGKPEPWPWVAVTGSLTETPLADHRHSAALLAGLRRFSDRAAAGAGIPEPVGLAELDQALGNNAKLRMGEPADRFNLLTEAVRLSPANPAAWRALLGLVEHENLEEPVLEQWLSVVRQLFAGSQPEFCYLLADQLIDQCPADKQRYEQWRALGQALRQRRDLVAWTLLAQGQLLEKAGATEQALDTYLTLINRFGSEAAAVVAALGRFEAMTDYGERDLAGLQPFRNAFESTEPPADDPVFMIRKSTWYRLGQLYLDRLQQAKDFSTHGKVRRAIEKVLDEPIDPPTRRNRSR